MLLVPYDSQQTPNGRLIPASKLEKQCPQTWRYLKACEVVLRNRENDRMDGPGWYGYIYPKNLALIDAPKILVPDIVESPSFVLDAKGGTAFVSGYAITLPAKSAIHFPLLLGLLNSSLLGLFLKDVSTTLRGGWYRLKLRDDRLSDRERNALDGEVDSAEHRIDEAVLRLYGVKELPAVRGN